jgi:hypothetical protein
VIASDRSKQKRCQPSSTLSQRTSRRSCGVEFGSCRFLAEQSGSRPRRRGDLTARRGEGQLPDAEKRYRDAR